MTLLSLCNSPGKHAEGKCFVSNDLRAYSQIIRNWSDGEVNYKYSDERDDDVGTKWRSTSNAEPGQSFDDVYPNSVPCVQFYDSVDWTRRSQDLKQSSRVNWRLAKLESTARHAARKPHPQTSDELLDQLQDKVKEETTEWNKINEDLKKAKSE